MGSSPSKGASNRIEPVLSRSESWSTLDDFVACETGMDRQQVLAVNTTVNDKEVKQVKTFPGRKPKSTLNLDVQSVHHKKHQKFSSDSPYSDEGPSGVFYSQEENFAEQQSKRKQLMLEHSLSRTNVTGHYAKKAPTKVSFKAPGQSVQDAQHIKRQATRMYVEKQKSRMGHDMLKHAPSLLSNIGNTPMKPERQMTRSQDLVKLSPVDDTEERLDVHVDALNNITHEPTDQQIKRQIQRWKTEFSLSKVEEQPKKSNPMKPKHSKSFYDLRKAMVNRENVSFEHSSVVVQPLPREKNTTLVSQESTESLEKLPSAKLLTKEDSIKDIPTNKLVSQEKKGQIIKNEPFPQEKKSKISPKDEETKIYTKDSNFEYIISKDYPPGFEIAIDLTELDKACNGLVGNIQAKMAEVDFRNQIDETLKLWRSNGFLQSIQDFVLRTAPGSNYSAGEVAHAMASSDADYLISLSGNEIHIKMAQAYALYCWIANNMTCNITSMLADEEEQYGFSPERSDAESKSASFDHCTLFVKLAFHVGLEAAIINGQVRTWKKLNDELNFPSPHSWNAVKIGGIPLLLDCFFGSGCTFLGIAKAYTPYYFGTPPQHIVLTHLPHDPEHQFLEHPLSVQDLQPIIPVPMTTRRQCIFPLTWSENLHVTSESQYPVVSVDLTVSNVGTMISAGLTPGPDIEVRDLCFDQNIQLKRTGNHWNVKVAIPLKGRYNLNIYCKPHDASPDGLCLSYIIHAEADSELKLGYPKLHEEALTLYGMNLIHWNSPQSYMCQNLSGLLNLVFEAKSQVTFDHFILPGRVATPNTFTASNVKRYNTMLFRNAGLSTSLHQLQAVFPTNGWWTVEVSGALPTDSQSHARKYTSSLTYYVYVTVGLPRNSYPHVLAPDVTFNSIRPINATGEELFTIQFATSKLLDLHHYLTFDQLNSDPQEGFSKVDFEGKIIDSNCYVYSLKVIFSQPGIWYIHVFGKEKGDTPQAALFKINADIKGAKMNTSFINYNCSIGESFGIRLHDDGLLTFPDNGQPLHYTFEALPHMNFFHAIKTDANEIFSRDYCTYLSSEPHAIEPDTAEQDASEASASIGESQPACCTYTIHAVFPENGKWLVQLFGAREGSTNYSLVFTLNVGVSCSSPQLCYPKINQAFHRLNMSIETKHVLIKKTCEDGEFILPFKAPDSIHFTWSVGMTSAGDKMNSNAFIHRDRGTSNNRWFQVVFPKPGEWLVRLFAKETTESSTNYHSVFEFCLTSLSSKSDVSFPQIFEAFYSTFDLSFDMKHLPLISEVKQLPAKVIIPIHSDDSDVLFWHDIDVKGNDGEAFNLDDHCKMISDPSTGQHKLMVEVIVKGKWMVSLYAKKSTAVDRSWTAILKFELSAL